MPIFIRRATLSRFAETGQCRDREPCMPGDTPVAARDRAPGIRIAPFLTFKLGVDERFAKLSPGVQLTARI